MSMAAGATVGDRLKALRESRGLSQQDMSDEFVLTGRSTLANYELGLRDIPVKVLLLYSKKFNVTTDWILKGETNSKWWPLFVVPYARYLALANHSYLHFFITYRAQMITIIVFIYFVYENGLVYLRGKKSR